ncbi:MAG TPA: Uma2 family endonuclease [Methylomirabilota bacterium]|nr:Uma2 family endonuclease [Methylomirabilota bacterium]
MAVSSLRTKHWTRVEYERLIDLGAFRPGERLELVGGALLVCEPQGGPHFTAVGLVEDALRQVFGVDWTVRAQGPIALDEDSEPEPDIAVVPGSRRDHSRAHPSHPVLIVEVADSSLAFDRAEKGSLYARAGIADYWILNLPDQVLEVYREPVAAPHAPYGHHYGATVTLAPRDTVSPLAAPTAAVLVASLLP